jgi:hypothetical protein
LGNSSSLARKKEIKFQNRKGCPLKERTKKTKGKARFPYAALAAEGGAASAATSCLILEQFYNKVRTYFIKNS